MCCHTAQWGDRALAARDQGAGKAGTPHNSLFASGVCLHLSFSLCLDPEGKGDGGAVLSVLGKKWRCIIWSDSLLIPTLFSTMIIPSQALAPGSGSCPELSDPSWELHPNKSTGFSGSI